MMSRLSTSAIVIALCCLSACHKGTEPSPPTLSGEWSYLCIKGQSLHSGGMTITQSSSSLQAVFYDAPYFHSKVYLGGLIDESTSAVTFIGSPILSDTTYQINATADPDRKQMTGQLTISCPISQWVTEITTMTFNAWKLKPG
jgi:hypothetical protein